jgi:CheY-like chemotaxis protein
VKTIAPRLKIIAASGLQDDPRSLRMEAAEAKAFLHKPFTAEKLLTTLRQVLEAK